MDSSRRSFLSLGIPLTVFAAATAAQVQPGAIQQGMGRRANPADLNLGSPPPRKLDSRVLKEKQEEIKKQVQHLLDLATELKADSDKMDATAVLSLPVLRKAEEIQKIAKHIQSLARG
jgi:hypothetical protein